MGPRDSDTSWLETLQDMAMNADRLHDRAQNTLQYAFYRLKLISWSVFLDTDVATPVRIQYRSQRSIS